MFIETYLDSLPEDTEEIDVSNKGLTYLPDLSRFKNLKTLICANNKLTSLPKLNNIKLLICHKNQLTSLPPLEKLEILSCSYNRLTSLPELNTNLLELFCHNNELTSLPMLNNLEKLYCCWNQLTSLPPLKNLQILHCNYNELTSLSPPLNNLKTLYCLHNKLTQLPPLNNLDKLYCCDNQLTYLHLNEELEELTCENNPIYEIINTNDIQIITQKLRVLNQFRYLYYSLKYKKRFRDWLWVKIREPKIRERYSHNYLVANLHEETDLDDLLENW